MKQKECKHEFVHVIAKAWFAIFVKVYCKHCGIDASDVNKSKFRRKLFGDY